LISARKTHKLKTCGSGGGCKSCSHSSGTNPETKILVLIQKASKPMEATKLELIHWIAELQDTQLLEKMLKLKQQAVKQEYKVRRFGSGKIIIGSIAEDFNEPLEDFKSYSK
jgi:hypothetical protein